MFEKIIDVYQGSQSKGSNIDPWVTPASTGAHLECWPLKTTLHSLSPGKLWNNLGKFSEIPNISSLYKRPSCQTLSNALEIWRQIPLQVLDYDQNLSKYYEQLIKAAWHRSH